MGILKFTLHEFLYKALTLNTGMLLLRVQENGDKFLFYPLKELSTPAIDTVMKMLMGWEKQC